LGPSQLGSASLKHNDIRFPPSNLPPEWGSGKLTRLANEITLMRALIRSERLWWVEPP
jgi:hypothetical protein